MRGAGTVPATASARGGASSVGMAGALGLLSVACLSLAAPPSGGGPSLLQLDGQCTQPYYTTLADAWRSVGGAGAGIINSA